MGSVIRLRKHEGWREWLVGVAVVLATWLGFVGIGRAQQDSSDVFPMPIVKKGQYLVRFETGAVGPSPKLVCLFREDVTPTMLLGCAEVSGLLEQGEVLFETTVTPQRDGIVRAYAYDGLDTMLANQSPASNAAILRFIPPGQVKLLP